MRRADSFKFLLSAARQNRVCTIIVKMCIRDRDAIYELKEKDMTLEYSMMNAAELLHNKLQKINFLPAQEKRD